MATTLIPALSIVLAFYALIHQRKLAEDERTWQRRADLYVDLLLNEQGFINPDPEFLEDPVLRAAVGPSTPEQWKTKESLTARTDAFASDRVVELWLASCRSSSDLSFTAAEMGHPDFLSPESKAELAPLVAAREAAAAALRDEIRRELKTRPRRHSVRVLGLRLSVAW